MIVDKKFSVGSWQYRNNLKNQRILHFLKPKSINQSNNTNQIILWEILK
jgi:hypothetical protein